MMRVWVVFIKDSPPVFLSVHATEETAREAVIKYTKSDRWGGKESDYVIQSQLLDFVID